MRHLRHHRQCVRAIGLVLLLAVAALVRAETSHGHLARGRDDAGCAICSAAHGATPAVRGDLPRLLPPPAVTLLDGGPLASLVDTASRRSPVSRGPPRLVAAI